MPDQQQAETPGAPAAKSGKADKLSDHFAKKLGDRPYTVNVRELPERGYKVFLDWVSRVTKKSDKRMLRDADGQPMHVRSVVPGRRPGRIDPKLREAVTARAEQYRQTWVEGWATEPTPPEEIEAGRPSEITAGDIADRMVRGFTVRKLFELAYGPRLPKEYAKRRMLTDKPVPKGEHPRAYRTYTQQARERRDIADQVIDLCDTLGIVLAIHLTWTAVLKILAAYRAKRFEAEGAEASGRRQAEKIVEVITQALKHAALHRPETNVKPIPLLKSWRSDIGKDWDEEVGERTGLLPTERRYDETEIGQLMIASERGQAPWRVSALMQIGSSGRLGQASELTRKKYEDARPGFPYGVVFITGDGKKGGIMAALTERERRVMDAVIARQPEQEARWRAEGVDYPLFPGERSGKPVNPKQMNMEWRALEIAAGVEKMEGRAWYGMRRGMADLHERVYKKMGLNDVRILESLTGHKHQTSDENTRESLRTTLYQDQVRREVLIPAGELRDRAWRELTENPDIRCKVPQNLGTISPQRGPQKPRPPRQRKSRKMSGIKKLERDLAKK